MLTSKATIQHLSAKNLLNASSRVVMRADFNVPIKEGKVTDPNRIKATIPTLQKILEHRPKSLVLLSHLGRPNGERNLKFSLRPVVEHLSSYLNQPVTFLDDCVGRPILDSVSSASSASTQIFLCENVRFHVEEEGSYKTPEKKKIKADPEKVKQFRQQLSQLGDLFVNDAFGTAHRAHSSVVGVDHKYKVAGMLMEKELKFLGGFLEKPKKPVLVIMGGAKVADKIQLIKNMIKLADDIILGGAMVNPFLSHLEGRKMGNSLVAMPENPDTLQEILDFAKQNNCKIHFPMDHVIGKQPKAGTQANLLDVEKDIPDGWAVYDCGPKSVGKYADIIQKAESIFWNGPFGVIEVPEFKSGSVSVLNSIIARTKAGGTSIIGGGDSAGLINNLGLASQVSFVSTGGGASLELLEGKTLPGVKALTDINDIN